MNCYLSPYLKEFNLLRQNDDITNEIDILVPINSQLANLKLFGNDKFSSRFKESLVRECKSYIKKIKVCRVINDEVLQIIEKFNNLEILELYYIKFDSLPESFGIWKNLKILEIF
jgi:hypothetical protein